MQQRLLVPAAPLGPTSQTTSLPLKKYKHRRVRTGCRTCRARKVKCDELRPACSRCRTAGRDCGGYPDNEEFDDIATNTSGLRKKASSCLQVNPSDIPTIGHDPEDIRLFEVFHASAIRTIPGHTPMRTWSILVPQLCLNQPAIAHAALAISSLHEEIEHKRTPIVDFMTGSQLSGPQAYALKHYSKALQELRRHLEGHNTSPVITLVACIVLTCFEALRGQSQAAMAHIQSGNKILEGLRRSKEDKAAVTPNETGVRYNSAADKDRSSTDSRPPSNHGSAEMNLVTTSFSKLSTLIGSSEEQAMKALPKEGMQTTGPVTVKECPNEFETLDEARSVLFALMNSARQVLFTCMQPAQKDTLPGPDDSVTRHLYLDTQLRHWSAALDKLLSRNDTEGHSDSSVPAQCSEIVLMRLWCKFISVRLWASIFPSRASLDALVPDFEELLDLCERCINLQCEGYAARLGKRDKRAPVFIMDMGVLAVLFFVGRKCTHSEMRWRAVRLVDRAPRREALWDAETVKKTLTQILKDEKRASAELEDGRLLDLHGLTAGDPTRLRKFQSSTVEFDKGCPKWQEFFYRPINRKSNPMGHVQGYTNATLPPWLHTQNEVRIRSDSTAIEDSKTIHESLYNIQVSGEIPSRWTESISTHLQPSIPTQHGQ